MYSCDSCGMGYSDDGVTQAALDGYYTELGKYGDLGVYADGNQGGLETEAPWELARARALANFIAANAPTDARVMDLGCSTGTLLVLLAEHGFTSLAGIEPLPSAVRIAREARGLEVAEGWITTIPEGEQFDVVVLSHVLEHVLEIHEALAIIHRALAPGGLLVVEVPDSHRFHRYLHVPFQDFNTEHVNHFSPTILSALIESAGYERVDWQNDVAGAGPDHPYPVVRGGWRHADAATPMAVTHADIVAHRAALEAYAAVSEDLFAHVDRRTLEIVGDSPFGVWGAGQFTMKWLRRPSFPVQQLAAVVDSATSRNGLRLLDHDVVHPAEVPATSWPPVMLAGSAYAAGAITDAAAAMAIPTRVESPFPESRTASGSAS